MADAPATGEVVQAAAGQLVAALQQLGRTDLATRATAAAARAKRPATIVCIVGEFKQGKSSLVNGLLGMPLCPVDDDLATAALTLVRFGEPPGATVRRRDGEEVRAERVEVDDIATWVTEAGNPGNERQVDRVDLAVPSPILRQGLVLVDTPGMGGLGAGHAAATLAFLPFADGLVFVSDVSAELSAPEVQFLREAAELCPTVLVAQTKTDLYPSWRRIVDLNRGHLAAAGLELPMVAMSSHLRAEALARKDRGLNDTSGYPELLQALGTQVVDPAKAGAADRSASDLRAVAGLAREQVEQEAALLRDPSRRDEAIAALEAAKQRLEHLRGPGARWSILVGDRVADLSNEVTFGFRGGMRTVNRDLDTRIEELSTPAEWDQLARDLQTAVAEQVTAAFVAVEAGRQAIREEVVALLDEEDLGVDLGPRQARAFDVGELWSARSIDEAGSGAGKAFRVGLTGIRGAQSGVMMFGMLGKFLPGAAAAFLGTNPVLLGAGAVFGGWQLLDDRKRKVTMRRQAARSQVRQFLDDVQFEVGNEIGNVLRSVQRELRDEFTERLGELQRTYTDVARQAQEQAQQSQEDAKRRAAELDAVHQHLEAGLAQLAGGTT